VVAEYAAKLAGAVSPQESPAKEEGHESA
jgi:hypothetical protein